MVTERSANGRAMRMTGTNADIDARKHAEEAMVAAERRLREVTDGLPGAVYQFQWSGGSRVRFNFLSAGVLDLLGVGREAIMRAPRLVFAAVVKDDRRAFLESLRAAITDGALEWSHEFRVHAEGRPRGVEPQRGEPSRHRRRGGVERLLGGHLVAHRGRTHAARGARRRRIGQPRQERVPGGDEPRDPHADERHPRHGGAARDLVPPTASTATCSASSTPRRSRCCRFSTTCSTCRRSKPGT